MDGGGDGRTPGGSGIWASALYRVRDGGPALELPPDYCFFQALVRFGLVNDIRTTPVRSRRAAVADRQRRRPCGRCRRLSADVSRAGDQRLPHQRRVSSAHRRRSDRDWRSGGRAADILPEVRLALRESAGPDPLVLVSAMDEAPQGDADARPDPAPILADRMHLQLRRALEPRTNPRLVAVRLPGLDAVGHYYLRLRQSLGLRRCVGRGAQRYGRVLNEYYGFIDTVIGHELEALGPDDLLMVVSGFGMEPLSPGKRLLERLIGNPGSAARTSAAPTAFSSPTAPPSPRPPHARVGARHHANASLLPGPPRRTRHGRLRTDRSFSRDVYGIAADHVYTSYGR